jgi:ribose transport system permease protein
MWQVERYALVILVLVQVAIFAALRPASFASVANLQAIIGSQASIALVALGALVPLVAGQFDLSVGSVTGLTSMTAATVMSRFGGSLLLAVVIALLVGALCGVVNGFVITKLKVNAFITTIGTATVIAGLIQAYTDGISISSNISPTLTSLGSARLLGIPKPAYITAAATLLVWYFLSQTPMGRNLHALGSNPRAARLVGIRADRGVFLSFVISGLLGAVAGIVTLGVIGSADPSIGGVDFMLPALAAVFLGATCIVPGVYNALGSIIGLLFVAVGVSGLTLLGVQSWIESVFDGAALIIAVAVSSALVRRRRGSEVV